MNCQVKLKVTIALMASILLASSAWAGNPCNPPSQPSVEIDPDFLKTLEKAAQVQPPKPAFGASDADVLKSRCSRRIPFTQKEMSDWLESLAKRDEKSVSRKVAGIKLVDESPYLADLLDTLLTHDKEFNEPQKTYSSQCTKVDCVAKELFGERTGLQLLFMLSRFGYNGSHLRVANADPWTSEELDSVLLTLSDLPQELISTAPLAYNHQLVHFNREKEAEIPKAKRAFANERIYVYGLWNQQSPAIRRYTLFHEIGHNAGTRLKLDSSAPWYQAAGWLKSGNSWNRPNHDLVISKYAENDPGEDFAESFAAYRYNPERLKQVNPAVYQLLKSQVYTKSEYTRDDSCQNSSPESTETLAALKDLKTALSRPAALLSESLINQAKKECLRDPSDPYLALTSGQLVNASAKCASLQEVKVAADQVSALRGINPSVLSEILNPPANDKQVAQPQCSKNCKRLMQSVLGDVSRALSQGSKLVPFNIKQSKYPVSTYCTLWSIDLFAANNKELPASLSPTALRVCKAIQSEYRERRPMSADQFQSALQKMYPDAM
jgi:hypothetical protein